MPLSGWTRRHKLTHGKEKEEWDGDFRKPPKPESYWTKIKGQCRWCGFMINNDDGGINERRSWHEDCATEYLLIYHSGEQRAQLWSRGSVLLTLVGRLILSIESLLSVRYSVVMMSSYFLCCISQI